MKHTLKRLTSLLLASSITLMSTMVFTASAESSVPETDTITVTFDFEGEDITIEDDGVIEDITAKANSSVFMPKAVLVKEGYEFNGWTADGFRGYAPGDVLRLGTESITFKPVWHDYADKTNYTVNYTAEIDGETIDISEDLPPEDFKAGRLHTVTHFAISRYDKKHIGWIYNDELFRGDSKIVMPDHDITLSANWYDYRKMTYYAGDVDGILGATFMEFEYVETFNIDLPATSRFSRKGYKITGWLCENDNEIYKPLASYTMPREDVVMYAVWEPINYAIVFIPGTGSSKDNIIIKGETDTTITVPECTAVKDGFKFGGWSYDGKIYQPGDDFYIEGAEPGIGISLKAVWNEDPGTSAPEITRGDANCDGEVNLADSVLIMQNLANPAKYPISEQGQLNGDVDATGNGITNKDALLIQQFTLGLAEL